MSKNGRQGHERTHYCGAHPTLCDVLPEKVEVQRNVPRGGHVDASGGYLWPGKRILKLVQGLFFGVRRRGLICVPAPFHQSACPRYLGGLGHLQPLSPLVGGRVCVIYHHALLLGQRVLHSLQGEKRGQLEHSRSRGMSTAANSTDNVLRPTLAHLAAVPSVSWLTKTYPFCSWKKSMLTVDLPEAGQPTITTWLGSGTGCCRQNAYTFQSKMWQGHTIYLTSSGPVLVSRATSNAPLRARISAGFFACHSKGASFCPRKNCEPEIAVVRFERCGEVEDHVKGCAATAPAPLLFLAAFLHPTHRLWCSKVAPNVGRKHAVCAGKIFGLARRPAFGASRSIANVHALKGSAENSHLNTQKAESAERRPSLAYATLLRSTALPSLQLATKYSHRR